MEVASLDSKVAEEMTMLANPAMEVAMVMDPPLALSMVVVPTSKVVMVQATVDVPVGLPLLTNYTQSWFNA